jgi:hypothetical protein
MKRTWRQADIEKALKAEYGNIAILVLEDMEFFNYYNNHFNGYWFKVFCNDSHEMIVGIIIEGMDTQDFHIEQTPQ